MKAGSGATPIGMGTTVPIYNLNTDLGRIGWTLVQILSALERIETKLK